MATEDIGKLGWTFADFGYKEEDWIKRNDPRPDGFSPNFTAGTSGGFAQPEKAGVTNKLRKTNLVEDPTDLLPMNNNQVSALNLGLVTPEDQSQIQDILDQDQSIISEATERTKSFISRVFDTEDAKETVVESAWDNFLIGVDWFYDRINQVSAAGLSGLPGGIPTLSWEEAADVSVGQVALANAALGAGDLREGNILGAIAGLGSAGPIAGVGGMLIDPNVIGENFDITNAEQRRRAFEQDPLGKWTSGLTDAVFTVAADPLIVGGKALKLGRIRWVDKPVVSEKDIANLRQTLQVDTSLVAAGETTKASPIGQFLSWVGGTDEAGNRLRSIDDVYNHPVVRDATSRDELTAMLYNADNFEQRALVMRVAYGDPLARQELIDQRAELADLWGTQQRQRLSVVMASRPQDIKKIENHYAQKANDFQAEYDRLVESGAAPSAIRDAEKRMNQYVDLIQDIRSGKLARDPLAKPVSKEEIELGRTVLNEYIQRDTYLRKAIDGQYSLAMNTKGFGVNNAFGRGIERSRQRRAEQLTDSQGATLRSIWTYSDYTPIGKLGRTVRLWRWAGNEKPAGYIVTKGPGMQDSYREIRANLNDIGIYGGNGKTVTIDGKEIAVGGRQRREELLQQYLDAVGTSVEDQNKVSLAVNSIEEAIIGDIAAWHGMTKGAAKKLINEAQRKRQELIENTRKNRGFWIDDDGKMNKAPFLESQLQNGTYLLNFRAIERAAGLAQKEGLIPQLNGAAAFGGEKLANFYDAFNSVWRPAILLRLGYTQRNVAEGLFRSSAYLGSLAPVGYATKQLGFGFSNIRARGITAGGKQITKGTVAKEATRVERAIASGLTDQLSKGKFGRWRNKQIEAADNRIVEQEAFVAQTRRLLDETSPSYADDLRNLEYHEGLIADTRRAREMLDDNVAALAMYKGQASRRRSLWDGEYEMQDGYISYKAFGNPAFSDMAWSNMSANATTRATLALRMQTRESVLRNYLERTYVAVRPEQGDDYYRGVADMLTQFRASELGQKIIRGDSTEDIAMWLRRDPEGRAILNFVNGQVVRKRKKASLKQEIYTMDDAIDFVNKLKSRLEDLTPNPALRLAMNSESFVFRKNFWEDVKKYLDTDEYRDMLVPAVGNVAVETGFKRTREIFDSVVQEAFQVLGTLPEDAFVRAPFYGRVYNDTRDLLMRQLTEQFKGKTIPFSEYARAEAIAHRRALRDTKNYLYTIERRTNLGHYGEFLIPFISATQNSVTALGRLTWRDPSIVGFVNLLWQAPNRIGMEDENGNIVIPLPKAIIPDGIEQALGLDNMQNIKINKGSLNVVFPETGFGYIPRPGPLFAVPASEIMKRGWFGMTVETPELLRSAFGEEAANELWDNWRKYIFGEQDGLSAESLSWDMWAPPAAAKIIQMIQGEGGSTSYSYMYNLQYRTELAKILAGERDFPDGPDPEAEFRQEIKNRTNGMFLLRAFANLTAFTPPQYESKLEPLIDTLRQYEQQDPVNGLRKFNEDFGDIVLMLADFKVSQNVAGVQANVSAVENARKYANIIEGVAPDIQDDLSVLGLLLNDDPNGLYDNSAYAWQRATKIPGLNRTYREVQDPEQAMVESQKNAGWTEFISFMDTMDAILQQRGLSSYRAAGAADLRAYKAQFIESMRTNPLYNGWYKDYINFGSTRTVSAVEVMRAALDDPKFVADKANDPVWQSAAQYLQLRQDVIDLTRASGSGINTKENAQIRRLWDEGRQRLINQSTKWASIANRYLNGDDDPMEPGTTINLAIEGTPEVVE